MKVLNDVLNDKFNKEELYTKGSYESFIALPEDIQENIIKKINNEMLDRAKEYEEEITKDIKDIAIRNGVKVEGLEFRLKGEESSLRKLKHDIYIMIN